MVEAQRWCVNDIIDSGIPPMRMPFNVASLYTVSQRSDLSQSVWAHDTDVALDGCMQFVMSLIALEMKFLEAHVASK